MVFGSEFSNVRDLFVGVRVQQLDQQGYETTRPEWATTRRFQLEHHERELKTNFIVFKKSHSEVKMSMFWLVSE